MFLPIARICVSLGVAGSAYAPITYNKMHSQKKNEDVTSQKIIGNKCFQTWLGTCVIGTDVGIVRSLFGTRTSARGSIGDKLNRIALFGLQKLRKSY